MEKKKKLKFFNLFDIIVILMIIALIAVLFFAKRANAPTDAPQGSSGKVIYTLELNGMQNGSAELVKPGDKLTDKIKKYDMGTVVSVEVKKATLQVEDYENGGIIDSEVSGLQTAVIVVESPCTETDSQIKTDGGFVVRVGTQASVHGPGYAGSGYIVGIERGGD